MATPENFQDWDLQKAQSWAVPSKVTQHDSMFEPVWQDWPTSLDAILNQVDATATDPNAAPTDWTTPAPTDATANVDATADATAPEVPWDDATAVDTWATPANAEDPMLQQILDQIDKAGQATDTANATLDTAIQWGDQAEIQKAYKELQIANAEKDRQIELLTKQVENEKGQSDRFLNDKFIAESDGREKWKIYSAVMENPVLKDIVIYSMNATSDPKYAERLKDAAKKLYEETSWVSVDNILNQNKVTEKQWLGDNMFMSDGNVDQKSGLLWWMFEQLPA